MNFNHWYDLANLHVHIPCFMLFISLLAKDENFTKEKNITVMFQGIYDVKPTVGVNCQEY